MNNPNPNLTVDPLFVGATRPPMRWGVTYAALLFNLVFTMELFLLTKNLLALLCCVPVHGVFALLCSRDARSSTSSCSGAVRGCPPRSGISGSGRQAATAVGH